MIQDSSSLRYADAFLAVCASGGVTRAAAALHRTQPSISYQLRRLEDLLGTPLFERDGRRVVLTPAGVRLRDFWGKYLHAFRSLSADLGAAVAEAPPQLSVASVSGFGRYVLSARLRALALRERCVLTLLFRDADEVFRMVEDGSVECGAVYRLKVSRRLTSVRLYREELVLITPPSFRLRNPAQLRSYAGVPLVTYEEGEYVFGRWFTSHFGRQPASGVSMCHFSELEEVIDAVADGAGVSIVPLDAARQAGRRVRILRPSARRCFNQVFAVMRSSYAPSPFVTRLLASFSAPR